LHHVAGVFRTFDIPLSWTELVKRTLKDANEDDVLGLAAQLAYYGFLALFPAVLFLLAIASFFPSDDLVEPMVSALRPIAPGEVIEFLEQQISRVADNENGSLLTIGLLGAIWSSSAGMVAIVSALNRAYDIDEGRPWWKVRATAIALTIALALMLLVSVFLVLLGPTVADYLAGAFGLGGAFAWTWKILQWPIVFFLVATTIGLIYYFAPDAEQEWEWITPGAVVATVLWLGASLVLKVYVANFGDYNESYGTVGSVIVMLLWFYVSGLAVLAGAEMNAEIEHASPHGKDPGEKVPGQRRKIGALAAREYAERQRARAADAPSPAPWARPAAAMSPAPQGGHRAPVALLPAGRRRSRLAHVALGLAAWLAWRKAS
jgi:membrane protein